MYLLFWNSNKKVTPMVSSFGNEWEIFEEFLYLNWYKKNLFCRCLLKLYVNRYRRGLETCPKANLVQCVQAIFFFFFPPRPSYEYDSAPSRNYTAYFGPFSPVLVKLSLKLSLSFPFFLSIWKIKKCNHIHKLTVNTCSIWWNR